MKKLMSLILVLTMLAAVAAGCARNSNEDTTGTAADVPASALEVLTTIWAKHGEDEKFPVYGGDAAHMVTDAPGNYSLQDTESLGVQLLVPADEVKNLTEAAALFHGMMSNNFSCGVFRVAQGVSASAFAQTMHDAVENAQWICGMPEKAVISVIGGEYVLMAFGLKDAIDPFQTRMTEAYPNAEIKYTVDIAR